MVNVTVKFNNRDYILSCEDGQEQELEKLSLHLNEKFEQLKNDLGNIGESKLLLISSIQVIDEMFSIKESIEKLKNQNKSLLERFKEIKNLSILLKIYQFYIKKIEKKKLRIFNQSCKNLKVKFQTMKRIIQNL